MKLLFFSILVFASYFCQAQSIDTLITKAINSGISKFAVTLEGDLIITDTTRDATPFTIYTISTPPNTSQVLVIDLTNENILNKDLGRASKKICVRNINGVYKLYSMGDYPTYFGDPTIAKATWNILQSGNSVIIQCTGVKGVTIPWQVVVKPNYPQPL